MTKGHASETEGGGTSPRGLPGFPTRPETSGEAAAATFPSSTVTASHTRPKRFVSSARCNNSSARRGPPFAASPCLLSWIFPPFFYVLLFLTPDESNGVDECIHTQWQEKTPQSRLSLHEAARLENTPRDSVRPTGGLGRAQATDLFRYPVSDGGAYLEGRGAALANQAERPRPDMILRVCVVYTISLGVDEQKVTAQTRYCNLKVIRNNVKEKRKKPRG